jgi:hypothetical protein
MNFRIEDIQQFEKECAELNRKFHNLLSQYSEIQLIDTEAEEYARHGFLRRVKILKRCIENVFTIYPPTKVEKPSDDDLMDLTINIQSFVFNTFGCIDNLAWIWAKEHNIEYKRNTDISFSKISSDLSEEFKAYWYNMQEWFQYLKGLRHALAHRIPFYIPPFTLTPEEYHQYESLRQEQFEALISDDFQKYEHLSLIMEQLGGFMPLITFPNDKSHPLVVFHAQLIADWNTILEFSEKFFEELQKRKSFV